MRRLSTVFLMAALLVVISTYSHRARAESFICGTDSTLTTEAPAQAGAPYHAFRPGQIGDEIYRNAEFLWDTLYTDTITVDVRNTLISLAYTLTDSTGHNPFGIPVSDYELIYDYFRDEGSPYTSSGTDLTSIVLGVTDSAATYPPEDRSHVDFYIFHPAHGYPFGGMPNPREIISDEEDLTTGHSTPLHANSLAVKGPSSGAMIDTTGTGWTSPLGYQAFGFNHEFQHIMPPVATPGFTYSEFFSAGAEAVGGDHPEATTYDAPYTVSLLGAGGGGAGGLRVQIDNYQARTAFMAYLVYNFLGADSSLSLSAIHDDLVRVWRRNTQTMGGLRDVMNNDSCGTCAARNYFNPNSESLDDTSRLALLHHNFRVADFVNNEFLDEGQYGFGGRGFDPATHSGAWHSLDGSSDDDAIVIPPEITLTDRFLTRDTTLAESRSYAGATYPLVLQPYGSEYWILRSDETLANEGQDLVVRVSAEGLGRRREWHSCAQPTVPADFDGRLVASVVGYSEQDSAGEPARLWAHPEWAVRAIPPRWSDVDSLAGDLEFVVPSFGDSIKAALVVITLADGPSQGYQSEEFGGNGGRLYTEMLRYQVHVGVRTSPELSSSPEPFSANAAEEDQASWAPNSNELAYVRTGGAGIPEIYTRAIGAPLGTSLYPGGSSLKQYSPDWSPRGDKIVFSELVGPGPYESLVLYDIPTESALHLYGVDAANLCPVFQPNGQGVAYIAELMDEYSQPEGWQVRYRHIDGSGDTALVSRGANGNFKSPRWTPDGQWVYFTANDSLYAVRASGNPFGQVVSRVALADSVRTFDLPISGDHIVIEEARTLRFLQMCTNSTLGLDSTYIAGQDIHLVALRDTSRQLTDPRFYLTGGTFTNPRISPDGTKMVYTTDQQDAGSALDLYVGSISWNHAPTFNTEPADVEVDTCSVVSIDFSATDPDGETVTYSGAYLPANSSISSNGVFTWDPPTSGDTYVVLRALDGSGGVAQKVVKISVPDAVRPDSVEITGVFATSTSVALEWVASGDDSLTGTACRYVVKRHSEAITEANWGSATHVTQSISPQESGGYEFLQINDLSPNTDYWFAIKVRDEAGDHLSKLSNVVHAKTTSGGGGLGETVQQVGGGMPGARGAAASSLAPNRTVTPTALIGNSNPIAVEVTKSEGKLAWRVYRLDETEAESLGGGGAQLCLQNPDGESWATRSSYTLGFTDAFVGLRAGAGKHSRTILLGGQELVLVETGAGAGSGASGALELSSANHSRLGDFIESLAPDSGAIDIAVGDTLELTYEPTEETSTDAGWFLLFKNSGQSAQSTRRLPQTTAQLPVAFALAQNRPNPFATRTTIHFDLPQPSPVRLEIFDAQGRRVAMLANSWYPAGFHSVDWDRRGEGGARMQPGIYVYRIQAGPFRDRKKLVLLP
jgi:FlgD Ig-like domain/Bacterial Ig domain/WD40-like Beta Propeller Repeat